MAKKPWQGRFGEPTHEKVEDFTESVSLDKRLYMEDILGSIAHAKMLGKIGILKGDELDKVITGLESIGRDIEEGRFYFDKTLEDVHMNIEAELTRRIGDAGKKLHTARSRNDQVATDLRLYLKREIHDIRTLLVDFMRIIVDVAEDNLDIVIPGMTHLQHAQPVLLSHHLMAYFEMFARDHQRLGELLQRVNISPLGSAALAGSSYPIDRWMTALELGFKEPSRNSVDGVSDRDFAIEFVAASAICMMHLSRLAEELIVWNSQEFSFIELPDSYATGSSIMPQKKNPDVPELVRGKTGRVYGNLVALLTLMKALPLAYNRDMQEDKGPVFDTVDTMKSCIGIMTGLLPGIRFRKDTIMEALGKGFITATDIADYLVRKGETFRDAHRITGELVAYLVSTAKTLDTLDMNDYKRFSPRFEDDVFNCVDPVSSVDLKLTYGGTSRKNVFDAIQRARAFLDDLNHDS